MQQVCLLGGTGSIGDSTLDIIRQHPNEFKLHSVSGFSNLTKLAEIVSEFTPRYVVVPTSDAAINLKKLTTSAEVLVGESGLVEIATMSDVDMVVAAIVGAAGLNANLAAAKAGKKVLLANKESLVVAGHLFMDAVKQSKATLLPLDSEHNAIFQCLPQYNDATVNKQGVEKILLTASGGPFREFSLEQLKTVTPEMACAHPNWSMGRKISVDSASLMNKGLELIEACWLFDVTPNDIEVVVHPQSIIHSMVSYVDGTVLAQMGNPDMRTPISYAMGWPKRISSNVEPLDLFKIAQLDFEAADEIRFPCLKLAKDAIQAGGILPCVLNAANEIHVEAFLNGRISFLDIAARNAHMLGQYTAEKVESIEQLMQLDAQVRSRCETGLN